MQFPIAAAQIQGHSDSASVADTRFFRLANPKYCCEYSVRSISLDNGNDGVRMIMFNDWSKRRDASLDGSRFICMDSQGFGLRNLCSRIFSKSFYVVPGPVEAFRRVLWCWMSANDT
ncbi:hypothetical protein MSG28_008811 [Choristoneura fumiferana]|uniref:Uncharacterized protein n=1 Tax=Choristoneura fumiferana TaxID=7141 RepID=A0ACC0J836_CHOFU|nr:hypothetical protein MSG28_008811 [Choristoneura fumiferana]